MFDRFFLPSDFLRPVLPELSVISHYYLSMFFFFFCKRSADAECTYVLQCRPCGSGLVLGWVLWTDLKPGSYKQELRRSHSVVGCAHFCSAAPLSCSVTEYVTIRQASVRAGSANANISVHSTVSVLPGWFKLQHPGWYGVVLRGHQSLRELGKHDHHVLDQGLLLREAGGGESGGRDAAPVNPSRSPPAFPSRRSVSFSPDRIRPVRERPVCLQDKQIPHVWIHDQLHP